MVLGPESGTFVPIEQIPSHLQQIAPTLGRVWLEDGTGYGTVTPVHIPREGAFLLAALHSFQPLGEDGKAVKEVYTSRRVTFPSGKEYYIAESEVVHSITPAREIQDILLIPIRLDTSVGEPVVELVPPRRGRFKLGSRVTLLGYCNDYLAKHSLEGPIASIGKIIRPAWDASEYLTTNAPLMMEWFSYGMSGALVFSLDSDRIEVGGMITRVELMRTGRVYSQAAHTKEILSLYNE